MYRTKRSGSRRSDTLRMVRRSSSEMSSGAVDSASKRVGEGVARVEVMRWGSGKTSSVFDDVGVHELVVPALVVLVDEHPRDTEHEGQRHERFADVFADEHAEEPRRVAGVVDD